jgi:DNA primase
LYADDAKKQFLHLAKLNLTSAHFKSASSKVLFEHLMKVEKSSLLDLMQIEELQAFIETISKKKVKREKAKELFTHTVRLLLNRKWLHDREEIKIQIQNGNLDEVQVLQLAKAFDQIKNSPPKLKEVEHAVS